MSRSHHLFALALAAVFALFALSACSSGNDAGDGADAEGGVVIGLTQFADHPSLDNCRAGFIQGMANCGYVEGENVTYDYQCAQGEPTNASTIANNYVARDCDLILAIATQSALSALQATEETDIPVVFCAISEPVENGLIDSFESTGGNITGVSDKLPVAKYLELIRALLPEAETIGIVYTTSEPNSIAHLAQVEELAPDYGFTVESVGITASNELGSACDTLIARGVDCHMNFTDNTVVQALPLLLQKFDDANIPVFGSEEEQVKNGCLASEGIDYYALGVRTGELAAQILNGTPASEIPAEYITETFPTINEEVAARYGITIPSDLAERAVMVTTNAE